MSERRRQGPTAIAAALAPVTAPLFRKRGFADGAIVSAWPEIVGARLAAASVPEQIRFPPRRRSGGTLRLRVADGSLALELQHLQTLLIEKVNLYFGYPAVARVQFVQGPVPERRVRAVTERAPPDPDDARTLRDSLSIVDDEGLQAALDSLGQAIFSKKRPT